VVKIINIIYDEKRFKNINPRDLEEGCYLIRNLNSRELEFMTIAGNIIHFLRYDDISHNPQDTYTDFHKYYNIIGKIKDFTITNIILE